MPSESGYSGTPLPKKLGIKTGHRVFLGRANENLIARVSEVVEPVLGDDVPPGSEWDVLVILLDSVERLEALLPTAARALEKTGGLWLGWPKKSSGVQTDLTETIIRDTGLATGLVDNKICAIDETWSGLRFVTRVKDR